MYYIYYIYYYYIGYIGYIGYELQLKYQKEPNLYSVF